MPRYRASITKPSTGGIRKKTKGRKKSPKKTAGPAVAYRQAKGTGEPLRAARMLAGY